MEQFPQNMQRMIPASQRLHSAITERRVTLPPNPELTKHAANTIARHSHRAWRIDKPSRETHIDAIIAMCMPRDRLEVDHIDHDHMNNDFRNLEPLCRPCHARAGMRLF
jgi:hypothetical protein